MKEKYRVLPKRIARSRKIQVRQFEPEEIWIEYELDIQDTSFAREAIQEATRLANEYLDEEEARLRGIDRQSVNTNSGKKPLVTEYDLILTEEGKQTNLEIVRSKETQFANFIHLWWGNNGNGSKKTYIGHLRKDTGEFKLKPENKSLIEKLGIKKGTHFRIVPE
ncbi:MAG: hypothetical protein JSW11_13500 [Candidatus Heimdallarchaeota archaeon]|nr:MAG: hypothetical protein JSW11_13500 [Candidatus Heimdallarchaeota archaeon]